MSGRDPRALLAIIVAAEDAAEEPEPMVLYYSAMGPLILGPPAWPEGEPPPSSIEVDRLGERGWLHVYERNGKGRRFAPTVEGEEVARAYVRERAAVAALAVSLDWSDVNPVLERFHETYQAQGARVWHRLRDCAARA